MSPHLTALATHVMNILMHDDCSSNACLMIAPTTDNNVVAAIPSQSDARNLLKPAVKSAILQTIQHIFRKPPINDQLPPLFQLNVSDFHHVYKFQKRKLQMKSFNKMRHIKKHKDFIKMVFYEDAIKIAPKQNPTSLVPDYNPDVDLLSVNKLSRKFVGIPQQFDFNNLHIGLLNFIRSARLHWIFNRPDEEKEFQSNDSDTDEDAPKRPAIPPNDTFWYNSIRSIYSHWKSSKISFPEIDYSTFNKNVVFPGGLRSVIDQTNKVNLESFIKNFLHEYIEEAQRIQRNTIFPKNLSDDQENAIEDLRQHPVIIQRPSDKTGNYVFTTSDN